MRVAPTECGMNAYELGLFIAFWLLSIGLALVCGWALAIAYLARRKGRK